MIGYEKKKLTCVAMAVMVAVLSVFANFSAFAEGSDPLAVYKVRLLELNEEYGTDLGIPNETATGGDYSEIVDFYSKMTLEEFDEYMLSIIDDSIYSSDDESIKTDNTDVGIAPASYSKTQFCYYNSSNKNALTVNSNIQYSDGYDRYTSINSVSSSVVSYPAYKPYGYTYSFSNEYREMTVNFKVYNYYSSVAYISTPVTISAIFKATGNIGFKITNT